MGMASKWEWLGNGNGYSKWEWLVNGNVSKWEWHLNRLKRLKSPIICSKLAQQHNLKPIYI